MRVLHYECRETEAELMPTRPSRLLDDLLEDSRYNRQAVPMETGPDPVSRSNALNLAVGLGARNIDMDAAGNLVMNAWLRASWKDFRLMWEPSEYEGVDRLFLPIDLIWTPDLSIYNQAQWRPLIGLDPSRYCALIGSDLLGH